MARKKETIGTIYGIVSGAEHSAFDFYVDHPSRKHCSTS